MKWRNHPVLWAAIGVVVAIVLAAGVVLALQRTGDAKAGSDNAPLIAAVIALGGVFTAQMVSIFLQQQRTREARTLEDRRTQEARNLEAQRAGEAALQNYFENVGKLLIEQPLRRASPGDNLSTVVRAQTLSVLEGLDPDRKRILLLFLYESGLIYDPKPVVSLVAAPLIEANLFFAYLHGANLSEANLFGASLVSANLSEAILSEADLSKVSLSRTDLSEAYLIEADLHDSNLMGGDLKGAYLRGADLKGADLIEADLSGAEGITNEELEQQAASLEGATMPNGQKYEDWIKSRGEDGENSGSS